MTARTYELNDIDTCCFCGQEIKHQDPGDPGLEWRITADPAPHYSTGISNWTCVMSTRSTKGHEPGGPKPEPVTPLGPQLREDFAMVLYMIWLELPSDPNGAANQICHDALEQAVGLDWFEVMSKRYGGLKT